MDRALAAANRQHTGFCFFLLAPAASDVIQFLGAISSSDLHCHNVDGQLQMALGRRPFRPWH